MSVIFAKGHGTQNDFVVLRDVSAELTLTPEIVSTLCDRRRGLGGDGLRRVATAGALAAAGVLESIPDGVNTGDWYMDYRNSDGSLAQMCGNGVRVFAHYLCASGLETRNEFVVGTPSGPRPVVVHRADESDADVTVDMGKANLLGTGQAIANGHLLHGLTVDVGNRHLACVDPSLSVEDLAALDISDLAPFDGRQFPDGVNVEILTAPSGGAVSMRVHEWGGGRNLFVRNRNSSHRGGRPSTDRNRRRNTERMCPGRRSRRHHYRHDRLRAGTIGPGR